MMCMTEHLSWVVGAWSCTHGLKVRSGHVTGVLPRLHCPGTLSPLSEWASYQVRKIAVCAYAANAGNVSPRRRLQRKPHSDADKVYST